MEAWRWSDLSRLDEIAAAPRGEAARGDHWLDLEGPRLLFVDGALDAAASDPRDIIIAPVTTTTGHPLGKLATGPGWTLDLARDRTADPVQIVHIATGGASHLPARLILAADATATVVETYVGDGWANRLTQIDLAPHARLMRAVRLLQSSGFVSLREEAALGEGASLIATVLGAGQAGSRIDAALTLTGDAAFVEFGGALLCREDQRQEAAVVVRHEALSGMSRQLWRAVASDKSTASLAARVEVARGAQKTDGEQSLRGLLLDRTATVNLKPELEIFADDVKCAHGATVGELDRNALYYMASRGIAPEQAKALLTRAFIADALARIGDEAVREAFAADADAWLDTPLPSGEVDSPKASG